jgi:hypothetical protein
VEMDIPEWKRDSNDESLFCISMHEIYAFVTHNYARNIFLNFFWEAFHWKTWKENEIFTEQIFAWFELRFLHLINNFARPGNGVVVQSAERSKTSNVIRMNNDIWTIFF